MTSVNTTRTGITVGTAPELTATFTTTADVPADPTSVTFILAEPDGTETTYSTPSPFIENPEVGTYVWTGPALTQVGNHYVYFAGIGNNVTVAQEIDLYVHGVHVTV